MKVLAYDCVDNLDDTITVREYGENGVQSLTTGNMDELFRWLLLPWKSDPEFMPVTWNLGQFCAPILKKLGTSVCDGLANPQYSRSERFKPYVIYYLFSNDTGGVFAFETGPLTYDPRPPHRSHEFRCYSLQQFVQVNAPDPGLEMTYVYATEFLRQVDASGMSIKKLTSPVAAYLSSTPLTAPLFKDMSDDEYDAGEYALQCDRIWHDCFKVGHWDRAYDYDITNAYCFFASRLLNSRKMKYTFSTEVLDTAYEGFMRGRITINDDVLVHPIITKLANGATGTPVGSWDGYITLSELRFMKRWGIGSFELKDGWFIEPTSSERPLAELMTSLYNRRKKAKESGDDILSNFLKGVANGIIGKFLARLNKPYTLPNGTVTNCGEHYNPVWHTMVTTQTTLKVADFIYQNNNQNSVIAVNTDGCLLEREVSIPSCTDLGAWRLSGTDPVIVVSNQRVMHGNRRPQGMTYDMLKGLINKYPDRSEYIEEGEHYVTLAEAVAAGHLASVGEIAPAGRGLLLPALWESQTREFDDFPTTGMALLNGRYGSHPIRLK